MDLCIKQGCNNDAIPVKVQALDGAQIWSALFFLSTWFTVWWCTLLVFNKQEIQRRDANPLEFFSPGRVFGGFFVLFFKCGATQMTCSTFFWWFYGHNYSFQVILSKNKAHFLSYADYYS